VWDPSFNTSTYKYACSGSKKPTVTYDSTSSGTGLKSWGAEPKEAKEVSFAPANAFIGTDEPPNASQKKEIESHETTLTPSTLMTIPVAQESIAIIVNLPAGCTATSTAASGRLALNDSTLQGIFAGTVTKWSQITEDGDKLSGSGCGAETAITPVVRVDQSGTTHIFKRFLGVINSLRRSRQNLLKKARRGIGSP
jgi:ABC-type phosphate transport system substrate-binding protein